MELKMFLLMIPLVQDVRINVLSVSDNDPTVQVITRIIEGRNDKVYLSSSIKPYEECNVNCFSVEMKEGKPVVVIPVIRR